MAGIGHSYARPSITKVATRRAVSKRGSGSNWFTPANYTFGAKNSALRRPFCDKSEKNSYL